MSKLSKALLESFDSLDSFANEASPELVSLAEDLISFFGVDDDLEVEEYALDLEDGEVREDVMLGLIKASENGDTKALDLAKGVLLAPTSCEGVTDSLMDQYGYILDGEELDEEFIPNHNGEHCPKCGSNNYVEVDDEEYEDGTQIYHYECQECGYISPADEYNPEDDELYEDVNIESNKDACYTYTASSTNEHMIEQFNDAFNRIKARLDQYNPSIKDLSDKASRFTSHACRFEIAADENHIVTVSLNRSLPDGIYNNDYIIVSSRLKTMHNEDVNIGGLNATHVSSTEDIGESYTYGIWKGDSIEDHKVSGNLDAHLDEVEKVINEYRKDS